MKTDDTMSRSPWPNPRPGSDLDAGAGYRSTPRHRVRRGTRAQRESDQFRLDAQARKEAYEARCAEREAQAAERHRAAALVAAQNARVEAMHNAIDPARQVEGIADPDLAEAYRLVTERQRDCLALLRDLTGVSTVRLTPGCFAILADQGYGEAVVRRAVFLLMKAKLVRVEYEVHGIEQVPVVKQKDAANTGVGGACAA